MPLNMTAVKRLPHEAERLASTLNGRAPTEQEATEIGEGRTVAASVIDAIRAGQLTGDGLMTATSMVGQMGGERLRGFFREMLSAAGGKR